MIRRSSTASQSKTQIHGTTPGPANILGRWPTSRSTNMPVKKAIMHSAAYCGALGDRKPREQPRKGESRTYTVEGSNQQQVSAELWRGYKRRAGTAKRFQQDLQPGKHQPPRVRTTALRAFPGRHRCV